MQHWIKAGCFEAMANDLRELVRIANGKSPQPTAANWTTAPRKSTSSSGARAGYGDAKRRKGSKVHAAMDTLGNLLALHATAASDQDRAQVAELAANPQATGQSVQLAYVYQGYTRPANVRQSASLTERKGDTSNAAF